MILLTGASGFIGKHLLRALTNVYGNESVIALTSVPIDGYQCLMHNNYQFRDVFFQKTVNASIDTIIHAGAFIPKSGSDVDNINDNNSNIVNTQNLLSTSFSALKKFIFISTIDVYGVDEIITEQTVIKPESLYGLSKYYCERMIDIWGNQRSIATQILRVGHVYGPGEESYQKIIPVVFKKLLNSQSLQILGTGQEKRTFIFINDVVKAVLEALKIEKAIGPVNIVGSRVISIKELMELMMEISGVKSSIDIYPAKNKSRDLVFDNSKMKTFLLNTETSLTEGLSEEWRYMKEVFV